MTEDTDIMGCRCGGRNITRFPRGRSTSVLLSSLRFVLEDTIGLIQGLHLFFAAT